MKFRTTTKALKNGYNTLKSAGYCELQHLLRNHSPIAYTAGVYGWNYDVYDVYGLTICTGYRGMPGGRMDGCSEFEQKARSVQEDYNRSWESRQEETENLLREFCKMNGGN